MLCVGDDTSDEKMFSSIFSFLADGATDAPEVVADDDEEGQHVYTVTVGKKPSNAQWFVHDHQDVENLLVALSDAALMHDYE